ncbi:MAG TPA: tripartite tricarboxylate transporter TctB family protein [Pseudolabrys sp.]|nr:tripartite tricarboxylate transporter TctB family protein [Pseudolabrys sp.]
MSQTQRDRLAGGILLLVAVVWTGAVYWTIPGGGGGGQIGPRGFPLGMGILLGILSLFLIGGSVMNADGDAGPSDEDSLDAPRTPLQRLSEKWSLVATFVFLGAYVLLLDLFGFLIGTVVAVASFLVFGLDKRSPKLVAGTALGLGFCIWLILGKAMGVYLPRGSIIDWF